MEGSIETWAEKSQPVRISILVAYYLGFLRSDEQGDVAACRTRRALNADAAGFAGRPAALAPAPNAHTRDTAAAAAAATVTCTGSGRSVTCILHCMYRHRAHAAHFLVSWSHRGVRHNTVPAIL